MGVQNLTPFLVLPHTHTHCTLSLEPGGLKLTCHTLTTGKVTAATQTRFDWLCLMSVGHPVGYVVPKPLTVQGTVGTGTVIFLCCFLTVNAPLYWKNCLCLESWDINNTHSCLSSPFFPLHLCLWIPSFLPEREKQNSAFFLSFSVLRGSKQSQYSLSFYHDLFSTKGLGNSNEEFFSLQIPISWCEEREKITAYFQQARIVFHSQPGKGPPLNRCQNEICSKALNFHYNIFIAFWANDLYLYDNNSMLNDIRNDTHTIWTGTRLPRDNFH